LERVTVEYRHYGEIVDTEQKLNMVKSGLQGRPILKSLEEEWNRDDLTKEKLKLEEYIKKHDEKARKISKWGQIKYMIHKWCFIIGIISLGASRGILGVTKILIP
jgi:hypothetical protein